MSSDTFFYKLGEDFYVKDRQLLKSQLERFGFGQLTGVQLPFEWRGRIPDTAVKKALVERGVLDLDTDVNALLRSWRLPASDHTADRPVTLRHLLSHTAGTTVPGFPGYAADARVPSAVEVLSGAEGVNTPAVESFAAPGSVTQYSGGGSTIVQQLVVDVTGRDYADLMRELVLIPFGMVDSAYAQPLEPNRRAHAAVGHDESGAAVRGDHHVYPELQAAGLWTTAVDLAHWVIGVQRALRGDDQRVISRATAVEMTTMVGAGPFGLGPELGGDGALRRFGHSGANEGFRCQADGLVHAPVGGVVMTNANGGTTLCAEVRRAMADVLGWGEIGAPPIRLVDVPVEVLQRYVGRYEGPFGRPMKLEFADGELFSPALLRVTLVGIALASIPLVAAWSAGRWMTPWADSVAGAANPGYKADTQAAWAFGAALGSFAGGQVASLLGRRLTYFLISLFSTALTVGIFMFLKPLEPAFLPMVFIQGLIATLFFGWLPLCLPELFPTRVRASGAGMGSTAVCLDTWRQQ